jgi:hypothetical protein
MEKESLMSTPLARSPRPSSSRAETAPAPTRQQLDELDALLQRMLELPVKDADEPEEPAVPNYVDPPRRTVEPPAPRKEVRAAEANPSRKQPVPPSRTPTEPHLRAYPASYMVVETSAPYFMPSHQAPAPPTDDAGLGPRLMAEEPEEREQLFEEPVPGGRHDLVADEPPPDPAEELARLKADLGAPPEEWVPFQSSWQPSEQTWKPLAETWQQARTPAEPVGGQRSRPTPTPREAPAPSFRPTLRDLPRASTPVGPVVVTQAAEMPDPPPFSNPMLAPPSLELPEASRPMEKPPAPTAIEAPRPPLVLLPLVWFNSAFDTCLLLGGPLGDWLKGKGGRNVLATVGLLCLAGAAALAVADTCGWTR